MTPHTYKPGDKVKIISMEEVRRYPKDSAGWHPMGCFFWRDEMDWLAGTIKEIESNCGSFYKIKGIENYSFSPEMISGPAEAEVSEPDTDRQKYAERLERFVLAVAAGQSLTDYTENQYTGAVIHNAKNLLAAFDEEVKKYKV